MLFVGGSLDRPRVANVVIVHRYERFHAAHCFENPFPPLISFPAQTTFTGEWMMVDDEGTTPETPL